MVATSLRTLAILEKGRVERMEYIKENVIEINPDEYDENRELQMQGQNNINYGVVDRNIEVLVGGDAPTIKQEIPFQTEEPVIYSVHDNAFKKWENMKNLRQARELKTLAFYSLQDWVGLSKKEFQQR